MVFERCELSRRIGPLSVHTLMSPSSSAEVTNRSSDKAATAGTSLPNPPISLGCLGSARSQILTVRSLPETMRPSGIVATELTLPK